MVPVPRMKFSGAGDMGSQAEQPDGDEETQLETPVEVPEWLRRFAFWLWLVLSGYALLAGLLMLCWDGFLSAVWGAPSLSYLASLSLVGLLLILSLFVGAVLALVKDRG